MPLCKSNILKYTVHIKVSTLKTRIDHATWTLKQIWKKLACGRL